VDLRRLQVFTKVYECLSFSRAAEEILLSQPTISDHIKSLEIELGVNLFDRLGRKIIPTRAAEILIIHARHILKMVEQAQRSVDTFLDRLRGVLILGGSTYPGQYILPQIISRYQLLYPEVQVILSIHDTSQITKKVLTGELEIGMISANTEDKRLAFTPMLNDYMVFVAWPTHPFVGRKLTLAELASIPIILREPGSGTRLALAKALHKCGMELKDLEVAAQIGSTVAVLMAVRAQIGVGFLSYQVVKDDLTTGRIVLLEVEEIELKRQLYLITRRQQTRSPAAQTFLTLCLANQKI